MAMMIIEEDKNISHFTETGKNGIHGKD